MARQISISVISATNRVIVHETFNGQTLFSFTTGLGQWYAEVLEGDGTGPNDSIKLVTSDNEIGAFRFADITDCEVDGLDVLGASTNLLNIIEGIAPTMFAGGDSANPLPTGAATAAKQDETRDRLGALSSPAAGSVNANLQALMKDYAGQFIDLDSGTVLLYGFFTRSTTTGAATGMAFIRQDTLAVFAPPSGVRSYDTEQLTYIGEARTSLTTLAEPFEEAITQITATGQSTAIDVFGRTGSFVYVFVKGASTNGTIALHASNDGTNYFPIANTAALTADTIGSLTWTVAYKHVKIDFVLTGAAGGTLDGTVYAKM